MFVNDFLPSPIHAKSRFKYFLKMNFIPKFKSY